MQFSSDKVETNNEIIIAILKGYNVFDIYDNYTKMRRRKRHTDRASSE